ncbi:MAG: nucleoside-diphosphate kinase [Candidatus Baldrarchaeia archaeon]
MKMERTLLIVKPDGVVRGLIGEVISRVERKGLKIVALKMIKLSKEKAEELYSIHKGKSFFQELIEHITSAPIVAMILEGENAIQIVRNMIGATDPSKADPGTIRGDYALTITKNVVHAADSVESAKREIKVIFGTEKPIEYKRADENWLH